jgi:hypothetical protein
MIEETNNQAQGITLPESATALSDSQIRVRSDKFQQIYTNNIQIGFSAFDMALSFGQVIGEKDGKAVVEENVRVLMPRELGKILAALLINNIQAYEQKFGEIKIPTFMSQGEDEIEVEEQDETLGAVMVRAAKKAKQRSRK